MKTILISLLFVLAITSTFTQKHNKKASVKALATIDTWEDALLVLQGIVEGISLESGFTQISQCLNYSETIIDDINNMVVDFKAGDLSDIVAGTQLLIEVIEILPTAIKECEGAVQDLQKLAGIIASISSPESFTYHVAKNIIFNGVDIYDEITQAISDYDNQNWLAFGEDVGEALDNILLNSIYTAPLQITAADVLEIVEGVLIGVSAETHYQDIASCIQTDVTIATDIYQAVQDFRTQTESEVLDGIKLIGEALEIVPNAIQQCGGAAQDVENLYKVLAAFKSPTTFIFTAFKNLLLNGVEIYKEITTAVTDFDSSNYEGFGENVGEALAAVLFGSQQLIAKNQDAAQIPITIEDVLQVFKGVLEGVATQTDYEDISGCINFSAEVGEDIVSAVQDLISQNPDQVEQGIKLLGNALVDLPTAIQDCQGAKQDVENLTKMIKAFQNPTNFAFSVAKSLIVNHAEIYQYITAAISSYQNQQWEQFGQYVGQALAAVVFQDKQKITQFYADFNNQRVGWTAGVPEKFKDMTIGEIKSKFLGTNIVSLDEYNIPRVDYTGLAEAQSIPTNFSAYNQWPNCAHPIRDQGQCGSCWAFGASEAFSDRLCIFTNGSTNVVLSPQWLVSCNNILNHGCNGGILPLAWLFMEYNGIVSDACFPYGSSNGTAPGCPSTCADGSALQTYKVKLFSAKTFSNPASIQVEIMKNGPVETAFSVYEDFMTYNGGIYTHTTGGYLGGHAVKIIGWGNENGTNYWIVANSWGTSWGENGFFRIAWGQCGIDSDAIAGIPNLN